MKQELTPLLINLVLVLSSLVIRTALSFASAFDRINVRRLFLTIEQALEGIANAQLFEFNDEITRANFTKCR
jgi:hypothetical protein